MALTRKKYLKHGTQHFLVYFIVLKWIESKTIVICLKLRVQLRFLGSFNCFGHFLAKSCWKFVCLRGNLARNTTWYMLLFEIVRIQKNSVCEVFFLLFLTLSFKKWLFVCNKTWHTTLFCFSYCVEMVRIENNNHMFEITC